jgi:hypothetical protein
MASYFYPESSLAYMAFRRCDSKKHYRNEWAAELAAQHASKESGSLVIAYTCFECGGNHIGHADLSQQLAREEHIGKPCVRCGKPIPQWRRDKTLRKGFTIADVLYCSKGCSKRARLKRKAERERLHL